MHERDREAGIDPLAPTPVISDGGTSQPADQGLLILPPPWSPHYVPELDPEYQDRQHRLAAERERHAQEAQAQLEREREEEAERAKPTPPAPKPSRWRRSTP
jgi:flagellar biosynthesis/type III secretory pathway protein FliH